MGGYGLGSLVFDNIMTPIINPNNRDFTFPCHEGDNYGCYPTEVDQNFKKTMYVLVGVFACLDLVGVLGVWQGPLKKEEDDTLLPESTV